MVDNTAYDDSDPMQPQIASPSLKRCKPRTDPSSDLDPHLHLMCDLLPCPHRGQYEPEINEKNSDKFINKGDNLEKMNMKGSNYCDKKIIEEKQYKQYLEAEKPDIDSSSSKEGTPNDSEYFKKDSKDRHRDLEEMVQDIVISDKREELEKDGDRVSEKDYVEKDKHRHNEDSSSEKSDKHIRRREKDRDTNGRSKERRIDKRDEEETKSREKVIKPKHSSSPNRQKKGVNAAIGQVCNKNYKLILLHFKETFEIRSKRVC